VTDVRPERAADAADVEPLVLVEALVLRGDDRLHHQRADLVEVQQHAALRPAQAREDRLPVVRVDVAVDLDALLVRRVELAELGAQRGDDPEREGRESEHAEHAQEGEQPELADSATAAGGRPLGAGLPAKHGRPEL